MICNKEYRLGYTDRAKAIVKQMTLKEKITLMGGKGKLTDSMGMGNYNTVPYGAGGCERLGVPEMKFCDGPRGCVSGESTCFPVPMARGASFDASLEERVGDAIGREIRANGGNFFGGVCINIPYNPGAGRSQETYGDDTLHMGRMSAGLVRGIQGQNVIACIKHFAFNSMENSRFWVNITATKRTEREIYLQHFKACVDAGAASVMSSYNRYHGKFNGANPYLLRDVLKGEWDFDGFVISDFIMGLHSTAGGIKGGLDIEMNVTRHYKPWKVMAALKLSKATEEMIDDAAVRIVRTLLAFTEAKDNEKYDKSMLASKEHIALALETAEKSITLIKNKDNLLPLNPKTIGKLAIVGDLADVENIGDNGSSEVRPPYIKTFVSAMAESYSNVDCKFIPTAMVNKEAEYIKNADAVVSVCGMKHSDEGEFIVFIGGDRKKLALKTKDVKMINTVAGLNPNTAVILMGGNVIRVNEWQDKVKSIMLAYYPGMEGGTALANIIFGKANPSAKLPFAIAKKDSDYPSVRWISLKQHYNYWHGYQKFDKENIKVDYPYGFGLSYTTFKLEDAKLVSSDKETATFEVKVSNTGKVDGAEVCQLYIGWNGSAVERPVKSLKDFVKVSVAAGKSEVVSLTVKKSDLAYFDKNMGWVEENIAYKAYIGNDAASASGTVVDFKFQI